MGDIENNTIIICDNSNKVNILKSINKLINIKFYSIYEFIKLLYFSYDEKAILYLIKKYNYEYDIAKEYLNNLLYIEDINYDNEKLKHLYNIKKELIDNDLLIFDNKFKDNIKNYKVVIYNYKLTKYEKYMLRDIKYKVVNTNNNNNYKPVIYEFSTLYEEVSFIAYKISDLIYSGVNIKDIKLANVTDEYLNIIDRVFSLYNLKISKHKNIPIYSTVIGNLFYKNLEKGIKEALLLIDKYKSTKVYNQIVNICNKYIWCNIEDALLLIKHDLENTFIENEKYDNEIEAIDYKNYSSSDEYVFMMGFNENTPITYKDEDYITDSIKPIYMDNTNDKNKYEKDIIMNFIRNTKNLIITYKLKDDSKVCYPSILLQGLKCDINKYDNDYLVSYSDIKNKLDLSIKIDNLIKFKEKDDILSILFHNYKIPYNTYSNEFTGLNKDKLNNYIKDLKSFNLSYSQLDNYNRCAFRFYINKVLKLDTYEEKFSVILGSIYHYVLEKLVKEDINIESTINEYIKDNNINLNNSNKFFLKKSIENLLYIKDVLYKQRGLTEFTNIDTEKYVNINLKDNINFIGFIDKIMYENVNNDVYASIIDYKTYVKKPTLKYLNNGIDIQLPIYMYLASSIYSNIKFAGIYLQNITLDNKSDIEKEKSLKLIGYSNSDENILKMFDSSYKDSTVIDGIKVNNDGHFSSNSLKKMMSTSDMNNIIDKVKVIIDNTLNSVLESKFDINPKYDEENIGCEFCQYRDLCFMKDSDLVKIDVDKEFGGEENGMD